MRTRLIALFLFAVITLPSAQAQPDVAALVQGNSDFAFALHQQLAERPGNLFYSPYSISNALAMTYAGAQGNTAAEMKKTLRFNLDDEKLNAAFSKLIADLDGDPKKTQLPAQHRQSPVGPKGLRLSAGVSQNRQGLLSRRPEGARFCEDA